jgi:mxaA protein
VKRLVCASCVFVLCLAAHAASAAEDVGISVSLRDTGYMLGDLIDERIELQLPPSASIDAQSLPLPGRVAPWLEVRQARLGSRSEAGVQTLVVTYQIFAAVEQAMRVPLPELRVRVRSDAELRTIVVPSRSFLMSPALPPTLTDEDRELRPSPAPEMLPVTRIVAGLAASIAAALACAGYLLWRYDCLPFLPREPGPLARTWRRWRRTRKRALSDGELSALLRDVHAALSRSAGETLYPSTLPRLFDRAPHLEPLRQRIDELFRASWDAFYGAPGSTQPPPGNVLAVLRDAADRERGVPC